MDSGLDLFYEQRYGNRCNLPCFYINSPRMQCRHLTVYRYAAISSSLMKNIINCRKLSKVSNNLYISRKNNSFSQPKQGQRFSSIGQHTERYCYRTVYNGCSRRIE